MTESLKSYYANGKILLTSEYFVLKGAKAIALPVKYGQKLEVAKIESLEKQISWKACKPDGLWFSATLGLPGFEVLQTNDKPRSLQLVEIFKNMHLLKSELFPEESLSFETSLNFNPEWGLGSSSTLIANLANWAGVDPYQLNELSFKGSGFDIACASADGPIVFRKGTEPVEVNLNYPFQNQLFFIYSGYKKETKKEVQQFLTHKKISEREIEQMNLLCTHLGDVRKLSEFQKLIQQHEQMVSEAVSLKPLKESHFTDFEGAIKSLGAWGGDFFLAASEWEKPKVKRYFREKGYKFIFNWEELILNRKNDSE